MDGVFWIAVISVLLVSIIFSMFGQGGGSLYTPILFLLGYTALISVSTSLVLNLVTAASASVVYYRSKLIDLKIAAAFIPGICLGALVGGVLGNFVDPTLLMWLFVLFLVGAGARMIYTIWEKKTDAETCPAGFSGAMYAMIILFSFAVGILSGLLGVGGGIVIVPFLLFICRYPMKNSAGTVSFIVIFSSLFGVIGHSAFGTLDAALIIVGSVAVFIGASIGARLTVKLKSAWVKVGFGLIMWVFAIQLILKLLA
ncbi:MAG: sulfite exporter TauE/SafE family protein [Methanomassiliicoccus sp.]|nr:sulfite exporter TauE/SafE family protein [Methanomassiliicoccus sp.]